MTVNEHNKYVNYAILQKVERIFAKTSDGVREMLRPNMGAVSSV